MIRRLFALIENAWPSMLRALDAPARPTPFKFLRTCLGVVLLVTGLFTAPHIQALFGPHGYVQWSVTKHIGTLYLPRVEQFCAPLAELGLSAEQTTSLLFAVHMAAAALLVAGRCARVASIAAWLTHLIFMSTGRTSAYGVDSFLQVALFYIAIAPTGDSTSAPSTWSRSSLWLLRGTLLVVYVSSGIEKALGAQWWNGEAIWRALMRPDLSTTNFSFLAEWPVALRGIAWSTLALEIGYPLWVLPRRTRALGAFGAIALHAGITLAMGLWTFGPTMIALNVAAWLVPCEPNETSRWRAIYDDGCGICSRLMKRAARLSGAGLELVPADTAEARALAPEVDLSREMALVTPNGRVLCGAAAFTAVWSRALELPLLADLGRTRLAQAAYRAFAARRGASSGCGARCGLSARRRTTVARVLGVLLLLAVANACGWAAEPHDPELPGAWRFPGAAHSDDGSRRS
jgi:predicted DCC family thiol-disulfide oxidoreductase YuxK